jgi:hypothetical protein
MIIKTFNLKKKEKNAHDRSRLPFFSFFFVL